MRVIKFRGWDKTGKRMIANPLITDINSAAEYIGINDAFSQLAYYNVVLQQYVGIVDKNGKEIYEGDIIQAEESGEKIEPVEVVWLHDQWLIHAYHADIYLSVTDWSEYEVIGNIYENPELIKS